MIDEEHPRDRRTGHFSFRFPSRYQGFFWLAPFAVGFCFLIVTGTLLASSQRAKLEVSIGKTLELPAPGYQRYAMTDGGTEILQIQKSGNNTISLRGLRPGLATLILFYAGGVQYEYEVTVRNETGDSPPGVAGLTPSGSEQLAATSTLSKGKGGVEVSQKPSGRRTQEALASENQDERATLIQRQVGRDTVTVRIEGDAVVLGGTVANELERQRAEKIAQQFSTTPVKNKIRISTAEPKPLEVEILPGEGRFGGERLHGVPTIMVEAGLSRRIPVRNNLLKVLVSDETVAEPVIVSAREVVLNGKKQGRASFFMWEARFPKDVVGEATEFIVEVIGPASTTPDTDSPTQQPTGNTPTPPSDDPLTVQQRIDEALALPGVEVRVIRDLTGALAAIVKGEVETPEDSAQVNQIVSLFVPHTISALTVKKVPGTPVASPLEGEDLKMTKQLQLLFPGNQTLQMMKANENIIVKGVVKDRQEAGLVEQFARVYADEAGKIRSFLKIESSSGEEQGYIQQVVTEVKVVEISKNANDQLGVTWGTGSGTTGGTTGGTGGVSVGTITEGMVTFLEQHPGPGGFTRPNPFSARLLALITEGKARVLSNPNLTTLEGIQASITVGGTIPIPFLSIGAGGAGATSSGAQFREYGIILNVLPEATEDKQVAMQLNVQVSSPDFATAVSIQGSLIPGFKLRQTNSTVMVKDGDTIVIGGLIAEDVRKNVNRIPLLSKIPILGDLFQSKTFQRGETELVIFLTPHVKETQSGLEGVLMKQRYEGLDPLETNTVGGLGGGGGGGGTGGTGGTGGGGGTGGSGTGR